MNTSEEHEYLLHSVKRWFNLSEQIQHYAQEIEKGPTIAEQFLIGTLPDAGSVLDIGCGAGRICIYLAEGGYKVTGIDVSEGLLSIAREVSRKRKLHINYMATDGTALSFQDGEFDMIVGFKILCYIPTRELRNEYLREIHRVLKPGGICLITQNIVPEEYLDDAKDEYYYRSPASQFTNLEKGDAFPKGNGYVRWFTESDILGEIRNSDFEIEWFGNDEEHEGAGYIRLIKLKKS